MNADGLPSLPNGQRWKIKYQRAWASLTLQRETWYGWKTIHTMSINPKGMSYQAALASTAKDILEARALGRA